jgi:tetratricopeptide (TPR) repeat protein
MFSAALTRREQGSRDLDEAIRLNPENATAYLCRGDYLADEKRFADGIGELDRAIQINPALVGAYVTRGSIYDAVGRYDEAINDFNTAEVITPSKEALSWIHLHRAAAFSHKGDQAASRRDCDRAVSELTGGSGIGFEGYGMSFRCGIWATPTP